MASNYSELKDHWNKNCNQTTGNTIKNSERQVANESQQVASNRQHDSNVANAKSLSPTTLNVNCQQNENKHKCKVSYSQGEPPLVISTESLHQIIQKQVEFALKEYDEDLSRSPQVQKGQFTDTLIDVRIKITPIFTKIPAPKFGTSQILKQAGMKDVDSSDILKSEMLVKLTDSKSKSQLHEDIELENLNTGPKEIETAEYISPNPVIVELESISSADEGEEKSEPDNTPIHKKMTVLDDLSDISDMEQEPEYEYQNLRIQIENDRYKIPNDEVQQIITENPVSPTSLDIDGDVDPGIEHVKKFNGPCYRCYRYGHRPSQCEFKTAESRTEEIRKQIKEAKWKFEQQHPRRRGENYKKRQDEYFHKKWGLQRQWGNFRGRNTRKNDEMVSEGVEEIGRYRSNIYANRK